MKIMLSWERSTAVQHAFTAQAIKSIYACINAYMNTSVHMAQEEIFCHGCCNATHGGDISSDILIATQQDVCSVSCEFISLESAVIIRARRGTTH